MLIGTAPGSALRLWQCHHTFQYQYQKFANASAQFPTLLHCASSAIGHPPFAHPILQTEREVLADPPNRAKSLRMKAFPSVRKGMYSTVDTKYWTITVPHSAPPTSSCSNATYLLSIGFVTPSHLLLLLPLTRLYAHRAHYNSSQVVRDCERDHRLMPAAHDQSTSPPAAGYIVSN